MTDEWIDEDGYYEEQDSIRRQAVAEAYENCEFFDFYLHSDTENMADAVEALFSELRQTEVARKGHAPVTKRALALTLANLCRNAGIDPECYTAYARYNEWYPPNRYNPHHVKKVPLLRVADGLTELGYLSNNIGFYRPQFGYGRLSRMRATPAFTEMLQVRFGLTSELIERAENEELVILRNHKKRPIPYDDTPETEAIRGELIAYNRLLANSEITINLSDDDISAIAATTYDLEAKSVHRVFNDESFELGGRYAGAWWKFAKKEVKRHILIDGEPTVECDFSAHHVHILYSLLGTDYGEVHGRSDDPYSIPEVDDGLRDLVKLAFQILINTGSRRSAKSALRDKIMGRSDYETIDIDAIFDGLERKLELVREYFYSNAGVTLQNIESRISEFVIRTFTEAGIVVLGIHDSFITNRNHEDILRQTMVEAFEANNLVSIPPITNNL